MQKLLLLQKLNSAIFLNFFFWGGDSALFPMNHETRSIGTLNLVRFVMVVCYLSYVLLTDLVNWLEQSIKIQGSSLCSYFIHQVSVILRIITISWFQFISENWTKHTFMSCWILRSCTWLVLFLDIYLYVRSWFFFFKFDLIISIQ